MEMLMSDESFLKVVDNIGRIRSNIWKKAHFLAPAEAFKSAEKNKNMDFKYKHFDQIFHIFHST